MWYSHWEKLGSFLCTGMEGCSDMLLVEKMTYRALWSHLCKERKVRGDGIPHEYRVCVSMCMCLYMCMYKEIFWKEIQLSYWC